MKIFVDEISFGYSSVDVLKYIYLEINDPQLVSIIGPNGVGKSTFIHCLNKILSPTSGTVLIDDKNIENISIKDLAKLVGYVPYSANDTFPLSVTDTVLMGRHPHGTWKSLNSDLKKVEEVLVLLGIEHLAMRPFNELSAGQHQKVMLARGLVQEPKILLLDEPTSNLDIKHQIEVTRMLKELSRLKNMIIIMISHDLNIAAKYSDNMILMSKGKIHSVGKPHEVITESNLREIYNISSRIIDDHGRPHVILEDDDDEETIPLCDTAYVSSGSIINESIKLEVAGVEKVRSG